MASKRERISTYDICFICIKQTRLYRETNIKKNKYVTKMIPFVFWLPWPLITSDIKYKALLVRLFDTCLICSNWITTAHEYFRWISPLNYLQWESQNEFAFHFETIISLDFKQHGSNFIWNVINLILEYLHYICAAFVVCTAKAKLCQLQNWTYI